MFGFKLGVLTFSFYLPFPETKYYIILKIKKKICLMEFKKINAYARQMLFRTYIV